MRFTLVRSTLAGLALFAGPAFADDLADFNTAIEAASAHNRVAVGYLRTGNTDLASIELDRLRASWSQVGRLPRPAAFEDVPLYTAVMTDIATRLITADMMLNAGRPENAQQALLGIRDDLYNLRTSAHVPVLADCIRDANQAMDKLLAYDAHVGEAGLAEAASAYDAILRRCDGMANEKTRSEPEFRRLIDGAHASLARIPEAVGTKDDDLLHRLLGELRSLDNLLAFRFG
jgi:hypothetical protein